MGKRKNMSWAAIVRRVKKMVELREEFLNDIDNVHIHLNKGNRKTGENCWTISLIPIADCPNCTECRYQCYDICNVCYMPNVQIDRARNSAVHKADPVRFWKEVDTEIKRRTVMELRINVGGDLTDDDFAYVAELGRRNPNTMILFFTKNYKGINKFLETNSFPENVKTMMSAWRNMEMDNPNSLPCSHVLWEDGTTTAPEFGAYYCGGNCSECAFKGEGCWNLKRGEHVIFYAH